MVIRRNLFKVPFFGWTIHHYALLTPYYTPRRSRVAVNFGPRILLLNHDGAITFELFEEHKWEPAKGLYWEQEMLPDEEIANNFRHIYTWMQMSGNELLHTRPLYVFEKYRLRENNCEHWVSGIVYGKDRRFSSQDDVFDD